jgi:hypothetical protein
MISLFIPDPDLPSRIPDPRSKGQKGTGSGSATLVGTFSGRHTNLYIISDNSQRKRHEWKMTPFEVFSVYSTTPLG